MDPPESSLLCSQQPYTGPYTQPDESSPYHKIIFVVNPF
jgi:hypothetical protein